MAIVAGEKQQQFFILVNESSDATQGIKIEVASFVANVPLRILGYFVVGSGQIGK